MQNAKTKKIVHGKYLHIKSGKYISAHYGDSDTCWNIFNDPNLCEEFALGFNTKWQAIQYLDKIFENAI